MSKGVLCVGEPLISLTPPMSTSLEVAGEVHLGIGGAELNVALHLARLGVKVSYAGAIGRDPFGVRIRTALETEGVECTGLLELPGPTGAYFKEPGSPARTLYYRGGSAGSALPAIPRELLADAGLVHTSGVSLALSGEIVRTVSALGQTPRGWWLSFDVNYRPALWSPSEAAQFLLEGARGADIVFVGRDEAAAVWGVINRDELLALMRPDVELVIKNDGHDVEIWFEGRWWHSRPSKVDVVEPVGAGDAFAAGYLAARLRGLDPEASAHNGSLLAAHVMSTVSDQGVRGSEVYRLLA